MPLVNIKVIEGVFSPAQKADLVQNLTEAVIAVAGEKVRSVTWVMLEEVQSGDWAIGGQALTTEAVRKMAAG
ncbi:MAG: 4-oxalocrotonate tautomerase family protein [Dongiaceae bacterium]